METQALDSLGQTGIAPGLAMPGIFHFIPLLLIAAAALFILGQVWKPAARLIRLLLVLIPAILLWVVGVVAIIFWRPMTAVTKLVLKFVPLDRFISGLLEIPGRMSNDPLVRGRREQVARATWPEEIYPDLYRAVPDDVIRPPYEDGMLIGGIPLTHLADRHLTDEAYRSSIRAGFVAGLLFFLLIAALIVLKTFISIFAVIPALLQGDQPVLDQWPGAEPVRVSVGSILAENFGNALSGLLLNLVKLVAYLPACALMGIGTAIIVSLLMIGSWMRQHAAAYEFVTKDALVRWPHRIESRRIVQETYRRQVLTATTRLADCRTFEVGTATGTLRARGDLAAPVLNQPIRLDEESLFQHMLVFGGTGEGKTSAVLKPMMRKVLADPRYGAFIVDAKGVLWRDAARIAKELGREDDIVMVGLGEDSHGVNLTAGLNPTQTAAVLRSVLSQIGGDRRDGFWPNMASTIIRHMMTIGAGYALTTPGRESPDAHPASLWWAYQAVLNPTLLADAIGAIHAEVDILGEQQEDQLEQLKARPGDLATIDARLNDLALLQDRLTAPDLAASMEYAVTAWNDMAAATKTGIIANVTNLLDGFASAPEMRRRFVSGLDAETVTSDAALNGKIVLVNLSSIEDGLPARLVMVMLKTALYRAARRREIQFRKSGRDVMENPCIVVMDEVQELATVDPSSGLSDATFWNVARSTGIAGLFATQTVSALVQAMGKDAADNFIQQARSKVFFRTEEMQTVQFACWCAGEYERNRVYGDGQRESIEFRELIDNWTPLAPVNETAGMQPGPQAFFDAAGALLYPERASLRQATARPTYEPDMRFVPNADLRNGKDQNYVASLSAQSSAFWRAEDKEREYRASGNEVRPALTTSDLMHMGRWHAFAQIQRAGAVRQDIITVEHDFT